jgi:NitT/TauT family transport system permease protein
VRVARHPAPPATPPRRAPAQSALRALIDHWPAALVFLALAMVWEAAVRLSHTPAYLLPAPSVILLRTATDLPYLLGQAAVTVEEALGGLALASAVALTAALLMAHTRWAERALFPLAVAVKVTPIVAVAPLLVVLLGFGPLPKIIVAALLSYFPIMSNAITGFRSVNPRALDFLRSLDAAPWEVFVELRLPHALPYLFSAYKVATTLSVIGAVVAEWVGADQGLGHVIILANSNMDMTTLSAAVLVLAAVGIGLYVLIDLLERRFLFWHESVLTVQP